MITEFNVHICTYVSPKKLMLLANNLKKKTHTPVKKIVLKVPTKVQACGWLAVSFFCSDMAIDWPKIHNSKTK